MTIKSKISPDDQAVFRQAMRDVRPLKIQKTKIMPPAPAFPKKKTVSIEQSLLDPFSDFESLDPVDSAATMEYARAGISAEMFRRLRRGKYPLEAVLDLHGMIVAEARQALHQFLLECQATGKVHVLIIHGKGKGKAKPILKNKLNHWLRQTSQVLAYCSAKPADGGSGALYVRLKRY